MAVITENEVAVISCGIFQSSEQFLNTFQIRYVRNRETGGYLEKEL